MSGSESQGDADVTREKQPKRRGHGPAGGSDRRNADRAGSARHALAKFRNETALEDADGLDTAMTDLLCDLLHLCDQEGLAFAHMLLLAMTHHDAEAREASGVGQPE